MDRDPGNRRQSRTPIGEATRRRYLAGLTGTLVGLAGCATGDEGGDPTATTTRETTTAGETTTDETTDDGDATTATGTATTTELDLREANVTDVDLDLRDGSYRFSVELYHDDDGEDGYANWWQVETLDGERLGRRELLHAHGTRKFTRSGTVEVPDGVARVVVRGHDQTHGYGGQAAIVDLESGDVEFVSQGAEPRDFSDRA